MLTSSRKKMSSSNNSNKKKKVVVLGAGYAGTSVARLLDKAQGVDVTIVAPNEGYMVHKIGALRAAVKGGNWIDRALVPTGHVLEHGTIVRGSAKSLKAEANTVVLEDGQELKYDALVIATGSRNVSPGDPPASIRKKADVIKYFASVKEAVSTSKNIVIVGSGAVAIELAGEIREFGQPNAKITLVSRSHRILMDGAEYRPNGIKAIEDDLKRHKVDVLLEDEVVSHSLTVEELKNASPFVKTPDGVTLKSGKTIGSDLLVYAVGNTLNTEFLPPDWLDQETREIIVDLKTLQIAAHPNVFAVGDVAKTGYVKRAYFAAEDGKVVAKNVAQVLAGKKPTYKITRMNLTIINFGTNGGRTLFSIGTFGSWLTTSVKSKSLFADRYWKSIAPGVKVPSTA